MPKRNEEAVREVIRECNSIKSELIRLCARLTDAHAKKRRGRTSGGYHSFGAVAEWTLTEKLSFAP